VEVDEAEWYWRRLNELASLDLAVQHSQAKGIIKAVTKHERASKNHPGTATVALLQETLEKGLLGLMGKEIKNLANLASLGFENEQRNAQKHRNESWQTFLDTATEGSAGWTCQHGHQAHWSLQGDLQGVEQSKGRFAKIKGPVQGSGQPGGQYAGGQANPGRGLASPG
jgi:hypothetical protein